MMKYMLTAAMILAAPMAFAAETVVTGGESHHVETNDSVSTNSNGTVATHDEVEAHQAIDNGDDVTPAASSTKIDESHTTSTDKVND